MVVQQLALLPQTSGIWVGVSARVLCVWSFHVLPCHCRVSSWYSGYPQRSINFLRLIAFAELPKGVCERERALLGTL